MKLRVLCNFLVAFAVALFSYSAATAQVIEKVKDAADKTKNVAGDAVKKTADVTENIADKTKNATVEAAKTTGSGAKTLGGYTVKLVDNVKGQPYEGGKWLVVTTWDGTKWVSKRSWFATKKAATAVKETVTGDENNKQP